MKLIIGIFTWLVSLTVYAVEVNTCELNTQLSYQGDNSKIWVSQVNNKLELDESTSQLTEQQHQIKHKQVAQLGAILRSALQDMKQIQLDTFKLQIIASTLSQLHGTNLRFIDKSELRTLLSEIFNAGEQYQREVGLNINVAAWQSKAQQLVSQYHEQLAERLITASDPAAAASLIEWLSEKQPNIGDSVMNTSDQLCRKAHKVALFQQDLKLQSTFLSEVSLTHIETTKYD
ncbi:hypothetical protein PSECIP111951_02896 [Pseudoalteromonas holothuriae]|uniref:YggN family protein n=1 Tax=Pseudoalteromonas holothuriae TaxID=2963714 RepID=A0ABN8USC5_9GAMM|nr:hypothetical protein [Pseudoalteromonas sp. CIP111951]CAH9063404.1 hypothetical protein PSECIP111951_02896 [Pseudoalteromonas sp. CIP111951]